MWVNILEALKTIQALLSFLDKLGAQAREVRASDLITDMEKNSENLKKAETPDEKKAVARGTVDIIRRM